MRLGRSSTARPTTPRRYKRVKIVLVVLVAFSGLGLLSANLRISAKDAQPKAPAGRDSSSPSTSVADDIPSNLNKMDMPIRRYEGQEIPCLSLRPPEELETLDLPQSMESSLNVRYLTLDNVQTRGGRPNLDLFAGNQSMEARESSYTVYEGMTVPCGFAGGPATGFNIADSDREFMDSCRVVVVTCTFGGGDDLYQPIGMTNRSLEKVCYVALWDEVTLATQLAKGRAPDADTQRIGLWRIVTVRNLPFVDQRRNGKIPKLLAHRLFRRAQFSIWVDSKAQFRRDPLGVLDALLWRPHVQMALSEHGARHCLYDEAETIMAKHKATPEEVAVQVAQYRKEGVPKHKKDDPFRVMAEASVIVREHTPATNLFMCLWFNECVHFTPRDQLSFGYVRRRLPSVPMAFFPVCTRRALVNVIGHKKKAKPLKRPADE